MNIVRFETRNKRSSELTQAMAHELRGTFHLAFHSHSHPQLRKEALHNFTSQTHSGCERELIPYRRLLNDVSLIWFPIKPIRFNPHVKYKTCTENWSPAINQRCNIQRRTFSTRIAFVVAAWASGAVHRLFRFPFVGRNLRWPVMVTHRWNRRISAAKCWCIFRNHAVNFMSSNISQNW